MLAIVHSYGYTDETNECELQDRYQLAVLAYALSLHRLCARVGHQTNHRL